MKFTDTNSVQYELTFHFWGFRRKITTVENWHLFGQVYRCVAEQLDNQLYSIKVHLRKHSHGNKK